MRTHMPLVFLFLSCVDADHVNEKGVNESPTLNTRLEQVESALSYLGEKLFHQDMEIRKKSFELVRQEALLFRQNDRIKELEAEKRLFSEDIQSLVRDLQMLRVALDIENTGESIHTSPRERRFPEPLRPIDEFSRSTDENPLSSVVAHLSQQLQEMSADVQVLKSNSETVTSVTETLQADTKALQSSTAKLMTDTEELKHINLRQDGEIRDAQTSTFIRWGSPQCTNTSDLVYAGVMGGSDYSETGAATNFLCLTMSPVPSRVHLFAGAHLVGAEYETTDISQHNHDAVCSVCRSTLPTTIMIPGTNECTQGWRLQYSGYLMAGYFGHSAGTQFICVDSSLQSRADSRDNHDGKLLYGTAARCGSLPCGPYANGTIVTCAVCSM